MLDYFANDFDENIIKTGLETWMAQIFIENTIQSKRVNQSCQTIKLKAKAIDFKQNAFKQNNTDTKAMYLDMASQITKELQYMRNPMISSYLDCKIPEQKQKNLIATSISCCTQKLRATEMDSSTKATSFYHRYNA